ISEFIPLSSPISVRSAKSSFKRPQDLKKHEKIHTEEHHAQHKHSKSITVVDPAYVSRGSCSRCFPFVVKLRYVDDFFTDMKKRRMNPFLRLTHFFSFTGMAERLNNLAYPPHGNGGNNPTGTFNPRSVSLDIRTPEELAAVNQFLVTLGRDVSGTYPIFRPTTLIQPS
ncbi:hypothetical protein MPER_04122, partial [Moniliophthora perniciosa FA553]